jgi:hypothetical protein
MKRDSLATFNVAAVLSLMSAAMASAQTNAPASSSAINLPTNAPPSLNRVSAAYRMGFNISAKFQGLGGFAARSNPGSSAGNRQSHTYDDGYVLPDSRAPGIDHWTWNWGFDSSSQVQPGAGTSYGYLLLHTTSSAATGDSTADSGLQNGFEIAYDRQLGTIGKLHWGLEGAFNFMNASFNDDATIAGMASRITDTYALDGLNPYMPPPAAAHTPYHGTYGGGYPGGGGPLIDDAPISRQVQQIPGGAMLAGSRTLDATVYGIRLGPYLEAPLTKRLTVGLSAGLSLANVDSTFHYSESVTIPGVGTTPLQSGSSSRSELLVGGYVEATASYAVSHAVSVFGSVQFQDVGLFTQSVGTKQAELDLSSSVFVSVGLAVSF